MSLKYNLVENHLKGSNNDFIARPTEIKSHNLESVIELMLQRGSTITRADILAVLTSFFETAAAITENGETINTDLFKTGLSISGVFASATEHFDKSKHHVKVNINAGKDLKDALEKLHIEKVDLPQILPHILEVRDSISGSINNVITSEGVLEISGSLLKIEGSDASDGVFFVAADGTKYKVVTFSENKPSKLIVLIPKLAAGNYQLTIVSQYNGGSDLRHPRSGTFPKLLTVV